MITATAKTAQCTRCRKSFDYEPTEIRGREVFIPKACPPCIDIIAQEADAAQMTQAHLERVKAWRALCPDEYRECDLNRVRPEYAHLARTWTPGGKGVGLVGESGLCKTRTLFAILRRHHMAGVRCEATTAACLSKAAVDQFSKEAERRSSSLSLLDSCQYARILLIDDVDKARFSDRYEMEFYALLEYRTGHRLPTLWSANTIGDAFVSMLSPERKEPILRRLVDFSVIP